MFRKETQYGYELRVDGEPQRRGHAPGPGTELKPERVQELLRALPGWQLSARGKAIERIAEDGRVLVTLSAPRGAGGLTEAVFNLARQIG